MFVNDKLETNQNIFKDIIIESLNDLIDNKTSLVQEVLEQKQFLKGKKENNEISTSFFGSVMYKLKTFKDIKIVLITIATSLVALGVLFAPDVFLQILSAIAELVL